VGCGRGGALLLCAALLCGCGRGRLGGRAAPEPGAGRSGIVIGVSLLNLSSEFIVLLEQAMRERADALGVRLLVADAQRSAERQVQQVESYVARRVAVVVLNPCEVEASSPAVDCALGAGIPVVNVNSETRSPPTAFVGSRDEEAGRLAMGFLAERLGGCGGVAMMHGFMGQAAQIKRDRGAREVLARHGDLRLLAEQSADWDRAKAMALMENWIRAHGAGLAGVFAQNDEMAMGAVIALENAGLKGKIAVAGVDAIADALAAVRDGRLDATVFQDARAQGTTAIDVATRIAVGEPFERETFIPFQLVTADNVARFSRPAAP